MARTSPVQLRQVTIVGFEQALATAITGVLDLFRMAGVTWARIHEQPPQPHFQVSLATASGEPCHCANGLTLQAHCSWRETPTPDLVIIPTIAGDIDRTLADNAELLPLLRYWHTQGGDLASNCTGAFFLAEAGLLEHREATTHWGYCNLFQQRYPGVNLRPNQLITSADRIFCAGGGMAWLDLGLFLVERHCGVETARTLAKAFVMDMGRNSQAAYASIHSRRYHQDQTVMLIQDWMEEHIGETINLDTLATRFHLTPRTFKRRFREATGDRPLQYLQKLRVEASKRLLEDPRQRLHQVTRAVGYEDASSFSRLFRTHTGMTPSAYRSRFVGTSDRA